MFLPFSTLSGRTFSFFGLGGGRGPLRGVNGGLGLENPLEPDVPTEATLNRYHLPDFSTSRSDTFVLKTLKENTP